MAEFVKLCDTRQVPPGNIRKFKTEAGDIVVVNEEGRFFAMKDSCPHRGAPFSIAGHVDADKPGLITCGLHGWRFKLDDGRWEISSTTSVPVYEVKVENGEVFVKI